jgi:hypothetical protein
MLAEPLFLGCLVIALSILWVGRRIAARVDAMSINLGNGSNGIHEMVYVKLTSIEDELSEMRSGIDALDFRASEIEGHVRPMRQVRTQQDKSD